MASPSPVSFLTKRKESDGPAEKWNSNCLRVKTPLWRHTRANPLRLVMRPACGRNKAIPPVKVLNPALHRTNQG